VPTTENTTVHLQRCLDRLHDGDSSARNELISAACERLTRLTRKMFRADGRLRHREETGDVFQNATTRLWKALEETTPGSLREFFRLAALQIRRALIDLARHHYGPKGAVVTYGSQGIEQSDTSQEPSRLAEWAEFHEQVAALPAEEREVVELVWYQGLPHAEAATLLQVSSKTIQRRWLTARERLHEALQGRLPGW
jgi:RNA polymerase sigma-70 factor (ECF subfamily)